MGWGSLFLFFQWIPDSFVLILFLRQLSTSEKWMTLGGWKIHIFGTKVLNFLGMPEIVNFCHIYGIYILVSIFSFINGASRILHLNLILMVLSFLCCKILCIYLCLSISVSKICHIVINIFASRLVLFLTCSSFFNNLSLTVLTKCVFTKKEFNLKGRWYFIPWHALW